ncbi:hypothetical protein [Dyella flagellata]|uniref:DUF1176 domain-containing protein n=1 Tax=Dyella flagellata TaxID=1867833 RepID=A0ABQ5X5R9_9GAMM|nr:hypothetical protein [Dyella flagellata]GLQ86544.1 hypothetical protein GCM10007898_01100 [Dyella flagellata]
MAVPTFPMRKTKLACLIVALALFATQSLAVTRDEAMSLIAQINAKWAEVPAAQEHYKPAPAGWHQVAENSVPVTLSFPCAPQLLGSSNQSGADAFQYGCAKDGLIYGFVLLQRHADYSDEIAKAFLAGQETSISGHFQGGAQNASIHPLHRVSYEGAWGRQEIYSSKNLSMETRVLIRKNLAVELVVRSSSDMPQDAAETFFNSLRFKEP